MALNWYIVHVYSGYENKVKAALEERITNSGQSDLFGEVLVPTEQIVELVGGKRRTSNRKFYPGYILVQMELNDDTWHTVNNTAKVTGFLGGREKPTPVSDEEVDPHDYLLDWRRGGTGYRYVHYFTSQELNALAGATGFKVSGLFTSDGESSNLGLYHIWEPGSTT